MHWKRPIEILRSAEDDAELREVIAEATLREIEASLMLGDVVSVEFVNRIFEDVATTVRQKMRAIAPRLMTQLVGEEDPHAIEAAILREVDSALNDLAKLDVGRVESSG